MAHVRAERPALHLVPIFPGEAATLLDPLADALVRTFGTPVEHHPPRFDPESAFDASRGQYDSRSMLAGLLGQRPPDGGRILGVTGVDLFVPVLTFVFGEAQLGGPAAVVSAHRLDPRVYGLPADPRLLLGRLVKEAVHELGHTHELVHCSGSCVMASSTFVDEIDLKDAAFCPRCRRRVGASDGAVAR